jgi:hypothetical protein
MHTRTNSANFSQAFEASDNERDGSRAGARDLAHFSAQHTKAVMADRNPAAAN